MIYRQIKKNSSLGMRLLRVDARVKLKQMQQSATRSGIGLKQRPFISRDEDSLWKRQ